MNGPRLRFSLGFLLCGLLILAGLATGAGALYQRGVALRGSEDPTRTPDLPDRLPLAGVNVELTQYDQQTLDREIGRIAAAGFTWLRQPFLWSEVEPEPGRFDFSRYDPIVDAVVAHKSLRIVAVLDSAPRWARRTEASAADELFAPPSSMAAFAKFAGEFARRYADRIDFYQIWDEPNLNLHWGGLDPRPADYAAMLKAAYPAIRSADPSATVITAGLAPTVETGPRNLSEVLFLRALYEAGAKDAFDAAAGKPYGFDRGPDDRTVSTEILNFSRLILLREEMVKQGDGQKALWGSHFGWNHLPEGWAGRPSIWGQVDAATQRRYTREAYRRAGREWPWLGGLILQHWAPAAPADDPIQGFAVSKVADDWFENGTFFSLKPDSPLEVGLHHPTDPRFQYTGDWRRGPLGADVQHRVPGDAPPDGSLHRLNFMFQGSALAFNVRRADYVAYVYIRVDGQPANRLPRTSQGEAYILLKSPTLEPSTDLILAADGLDPGLHSVEARFYLGYERWLLAGIAIGEPPDTRDYDLPIAAAGISLLLGVLGTVLLVRRLPRRAASSALSSILVYLRRMADILAAILISLLTSLGLILSVGDALPNVFRRDVPTFLLTALTAGLVYFSPAFIVTAAGLVVLWLIIYNRPVVGLALIIFWAPFFLLPVQLYLFALPMVEVCLVLAVSAAAARALIGWARGHKATPPTSAVANKAEGQTQPASRMTLADWAILAFVVVGTLSLAWSEQINPALREWRLMVIEPALFYLLLRTARLSGSDTARLVDVFLLAGTAIAAIGLIEYFDVTGAGVVVAEQGARRLNSVYWSPNNAALLLGRCIPYGFAMLLLAPGGLRRALAGLMTLIMLIAVLLTQSAGAALLGVPASLIVVLLLWDRRRGALATLLIVLGLLSVIPLSRFIPRLQGVLDLTRSSSFVRTQLWTSSFYLLRERPLTGAGLDQFLYLYRSRYILPEAWAEPDLSHPHNLILDYWISLGLAGLPILAALQLSFWRSGLAAWRRWRGLGAEGALTAALVAGALGSMANFLVHGLVDNSYFVVDLAFVFCFTLALSQNVATSRQDQV